MKPALLVRILLVATVLAAGNAGVVLYFGDLNAKASDAEGKRLDGAVTGALRRHVEAAALFAREASEDDAGHAARARAFAAVFPALAGTARVGADGQVLAWAEVGGASAGTSAPAAGAPAAREAIAGRMAVDDPYPAPDGDSVFAVWAPVAAGGRPGAVVAVFRLDRLLEETMDAAAGAESPYLLRDSRGRDVCRRGELPAEVLDVPVRMPGLTWSVRTRAPDGARDRTVALFWGVIVLSAALWAGYTVACVRAARDAATLHENARRLQQLADVEHRERTRLTTLLDSLEDGVVLAGPDGAWLTSNVAGIRLLGSAPEFTRADGTPLPPEETALRQAIARGAKVHQEDCWLRREGKVLRLAVVAAPLFGENRAVTGAVGVYRDVSRQREWEELVRSRDFDLTARARFTAELAEAKTEDEIRKKLSKALEDVLAPLGIHIFLKPPGSSRLRGARAPSTAPGAAEAEAPVVLDNAICSVLETGEALDPRRTKERVQPCLGRISPGGVLCAPVVIGDKVAGTVHLELPTVDPDPGRVELAFELIRAASAAIGSRRYMDVVSKAAIQDQLTGLFNRRHFDEVSRVMVAQARRHSKPLAVLMMDIDHFKQFNDRFGHDAGDVVLREFAITLRRTARESDVMVRYGGEEFAGLLPETSLAAARVAAERILEGTRGIRLPIPGLERGGVTVSIGVAAFPEQGDTPEALVKAADTALYAAKSGGRNRVVLAGESRVPGAPQ